MAPRGRVPRPSDDIFGELTGQYWEIRKTDPSLPTRRGDCNADACRSFKPGGPRIAALEDVVDRDPGDLGLNYNDDCSHVAPRGHQKSPAVRAFGPPAAARYSADGHRLAGMDYVPGVGACCTNATAPAGCVAPLPVCFHATGAAAVRRPPQVLRRRLGRGAGPQNPGAVP